MFMMGLFYHGFFRSIFCPDDAIGAILFYCQRPGICHPPKSLYRIVVMGNRPKKQGRVDALKKLFFT